MTLTTLLKNQIRDDTKLALEAIMLFGGTGEGTTTPDQADTDLELEVFRKAIDDFDSSQSDRITASLALTVNEANGDALTETGWFDENIFSIDDCDVITGWVDSADMTITSNTTTFKENEASLNLTKDAGASATASTAKTTTSRVFTDKSLSIWLFIVDAPALAKLAVSNCFTIRFGSGAGDYYEWQKDLADLSVGWNLIKGLTIANSDSTTGTPVLAAMDYTFVGLTATGAGITWSAGDFIIDDIRLASGNLWTHNLFTVIDKIDSIGVFLDSTIVIEVTES